LFGKSSCRRFFEKEVKMGKSPTKLLDSSIEVDIEITHALIIFYVASIFLPRAIQAADKCNASVSPFSLSTACRSAI
jgi:hypothetical protein